MFDIGIEVVDKCHSKIKKKCPLTSTRSTTRVRTININHLGGNLEH